MREPGTGRKDWTGPSHFMTDFYIQKFQLPTEEFVLFSDQTYHVFNGKPPIKRAGTIYMSPTANYCKRTQSMELDLNHSSKTWGFEHELQSTVQLDNYYTHCYLL